MMVVGTKIVIGLYILDMWSVLFVTTHIHMTTWYVQSNIVIGLYILDHVVSVVQSLCGWCGLK